MQQSEVGKKAEALACEQEAVEIRRGLASTYPEVFLPDLAGSLNNLGVLQSALEQREEALASSLEAVEHYRKLAAAHPESFLPELARSLHNLGLLRSALGQGAEALDSAQEAFAIIWPLFIEIPRAYLAQTGLFFIHLVKRLEEVGRPVTDELRRKQAALMAVTSRIKAPSEPG